LIDFEKKAELAEIPSSVAPASDVQYGLAASQTTTHVGFLFPSLPM